MNRLAVALLCILVSITGAAYDGKIDLGKLKVEPEHRCVPYDAGKYRYPDDMDRELVEANGYIVDRDGRINYAYPSPYTPGISFRFVQDMDIEHIVAKSEAHDSGLCSRPDEWTPFASDTINITVAGEHVNRTRKRGKDAAEWMPDTNRCWFARTVVAVKTKYGLSVDKAERDALAKVLDGCYLD